MDSFIYALVLVPAMRELLPRSGIEPTTGAIGYYGGVLFALFLVGWGLSLLWGPVGGPVRARSHVDVDDPMLFLLHFCICARY